VFKFNAGFCSLLTKFYLSKVVQRGTMKQGGKPALNLTRDRYQQGEERQRQRL
jgi:hypothetical protein